MNAIAMMPEPVPVLERKCVIHEVLAMSLIELLKLAPRNPLVRGLILAQTGQMPPVEYETYEQIKDWVETTCQKKARPPQVSTDNDTAVAIRVEFSEMEYGKASYSVSRSGAEDFHFTPEDLLEMAEVCVGNGDGFDALVRAIESKISHEAWEQCEPDMDNYGDYEYDSHDSDNSDNSSVEFSTTEIEELVRNYLTQHHPDLLEQL
jgi:hypothetical protein